MATRISVQQTGWEAECSSDREEAKISPPSPPPTTPARPRAPCGSLPRGQPRADPRTTSSPKLTLHLNRPPDLMPPAWVAKSPRLCLSRPRRSGCGSAAQGRPARCVPGGVASVGSAQQRSRGVASVGSAQHARAHCMPRRASAHPARSQLTGQTAPEGPAGHTRL